MTVRPTRGRILSMIVIATAICLSGAPIALADHFRVCFGEDQANGCPVAHDAMYGCGASIDDAASQICAVTTNGKRTVAPYSFVRQGSHGGGRCGYDWYDLNCRF
jgi:hypothetical protein